MRGVEWPLEFVQTTILHLTMERKQWKKKKTMKRRDRSHTTGSLDHSSSHSSPHSCWPLKLPPHSQTKEEETGRRIPNKTSTNDQRHHSKELSKRQGSEAGQGKKMRTTAATGQRHSDHNNHSRCSNNSHTESTKSSRIQK
jgi:hypothetical protein